MIRYCRGSSALHVSVAAWLYVVINLINSACWAWQSTGSFLDLRPGYFHVMVDIRSGISQSDKLLLTGRRLQAAGVDSFLVAENDYPSCIDKNNNDDDKKLSDSEMVTDSHYLPLSERLPVDSSSSSSSNAYRLWELSETANNNQIITPTTSSTYDNLIQEVFVLSGDDVFVIQAMNDLLGSGAMCLWRPPSSMARTLLSTGTNPISVWRLRSNPGIMGIVLDWQDIREVCLQQQQSQNKEDMLDVAPIYASLKNMRKPCSAMDYPPTIYMIGEDEVN